MTTTSSPPRCSAPGPGRPPLTDAAAYGRQRRNVVQVQDELWRALRVAPGLVERSDRITRLGRHRGVVSIQVTHSLDDLEALPTEADRAKARGMAARNGVLLLGGMAEKELDGLRRITPLSQGEAALVTSWAAPPTWHAGRIHPGRGKYLIKSGQRIGLPVALTLTPTELASTTPTAPSDAHGTHASTRRRCSATRPHRCCCSPLIAAVAVLDRRRRGSPLGIADAPGTGELGPPDVEPRTAAQSGRATAPAAVHRRADALLRSTRVRR